MKEFTEIIEFLKAEILKIDADAELYFDSLSDIEDSIEQYFIPNNDISSQQRKYYFIADKVIMLYYDVEYYGERGEIHNLHEVLFVDKQHVLTLIKHCIMNCDDEIRYANMRIKDLKALAYDVENNQ